MKLLRIQGTDVEEVVSLRNKGQNLAHTVKEEQENISLSSHLVSLSAYLLYASHPASAYK